jgi:hypothetical protein
MDWVAKVQEVRKSDEEAAEEKTNERGEINDIEDNVSCVLLVGETEMNELLLLIHRFDIDSLRRGEEKLKQRAPQQFKTDCEPEP